MQAKYVRPTLKFGGGSVMVWGCMTAKGVGIVHRIVGTMTAQSYVNILSTNLPITAEKLSVIHCKKRSWSQSMMHAINLRIMHPK